MEILDANVPFPSTLLGWDPHGHAVDGADAGVDPMDVGAWDVEGVRAKVAPSWAEVGVGDEAGAERRCAGMTVVFDGVEGRAG